MNILLINNYWIPEIGAASHLYFYLAKSLRKKGHNVFVLTGIPRYNVDKATYDRYFKKGKMFIEEQEGIKVIRCRLPFVERNKKIRRGLELFQISSKLFKCGAKSLFNEKIDVSLVYSPPLTLYKTAENLRENLGIPYILNVQDLFPQYAITLGVMNNKLVVNYFKKMEQKAYKSANLITVHSEKNAEFVEKVLNEKKISDKIEVVENWIDENQVKPGPKSNEFSKKYGIFDKFVVSFAGTLGYAQDIEVILNAAEMTKHKSDIIYVIVGDGTKKEKAQKIISSKNLRNVLMLPTVPREVYPLVLNSSDISLATLRKEIETPVVPSKILSIMSAGIPVVATMNLNGDAPVLIKKAKAGFVFQAGEAKSMAEAILKLYEDKKLREDFGNNGRRYIEEHLSAKIAAEKYEKLFEKVIREYNKKGANSYEK